MTIQKRFYSKINLNNHGIGLIEGLIAASIIGIVCLGMGSVAANMQRVQEQATLFATLNTLSQNMQKSILDANGWRNTVAGTVVGADNSSAFNCIYTNASCPKTVNYPLTGAQTELDYDAFAAIYDGNSAPGGIIYKDNGTDGFNFQGQPCTGFVSDMTVVGSDQCPISYRLRVAKFCSDFSASCIQPSLLVYGVLQYHPGRWGSTFPVNTSRYNVSVARGAGAYNRNDSVRVEDKTTTGAPLSTGTCATTGTDRTLVSSADLAGNIVSIAGGTVTLKPGGYICNALAAGYAVDGFSISLLVDGVPKATSPMAIATATPASLQQARISDFSINQTANFTLRLRQQCQTAGTAGTAFGLPLNFTGIDNVYAGIYCTRVY